VLSSHLPFGFGILIHIVRNQGSGKFYEKEFKIIPIVGILEVNTYLNPDLSPTHPPKGTLVRIISSVLQRD
jgi:hypothetical protein